MFFVEDQITTNTQSLYYYPFFNSPYYTKENYDPSFCSPSPYEILHSTSVYESAIDMMKNGREIFDSESKENLLFSTSLEKEKRTSAELNMFDERCTSDYQDVADSYNRSNNSYHDGEAYGSNRSYKPDDGKYLNPGLRIARRNREIKHFISDLFEHRSKELVETRDVLMEIFRSPVSVIHVPEAVRKILFDNPQIMVDLKLMDKLYVYGRKHFHSSLEASFTSVKASFRKFVAKNRDLYGMKMVKISHRHLTSSDKDKYVVLSKKGSDEHIIVHSNGWYLSKL